MKRYVVNNSHFVLADSYANVWEYNDKTESWVDTTTLTAWGKSSPFARWAKKCNIPDIDPDYYFPRLHQFEGSVRGFKVCVSVLFTGAGKYTVVFEVFKKSECVAFDIRINQPESNITEEQLVYFALSPLKQVIPCPSDVDAVEFYRPVRQELEKNFC